MIENATPMMGQSLLKLVKTIFPNNQCMRFSLLVPPSKVNRKVLYEKLLSAEVSGVPSKAEKKFKPYQEKL